MKFPGFKEFDSRIPSLTQIFDYLRIEHTANLKELVTGLNRLTLDENFLSFTVSVEIPAGQETAIENKLRGSIPSHRIITRSNVAEIVDGATAWTKEFVYLKNLGATNAQVTVIFLK